MKRKTEYPANWLTSGFSSEQLETMAALAIISTKIYTRRLELGLGQKEFAKKMGVSQSMVSKWESENYNFSIETLIKICSKLDLEFNPEIACKEPEPEEITYNESPAQNSPPVLSWIPYKGAAEGGAA